MQDQSTVEAVSAGTVRWFDGDMHMCEPVDLWRDYLPEQYQEYMPQWLGDRSRGDHQLFVRHFNIRGSQVPKAGDKDPIPHEASQPDRVADFEPYLSPDKRYVDPAGQLRAMETEGIDVAVLFPTIGFHPWGDERLPGDAALALAAAYNSWLHDFCSEDPRRLRMHALIPLHDVDAAVGELKRVLRLGAVSVTPSQSTVRLDDPKYEPFWAEAEALGIAIAFHGLTASHLKERYADSRLMCHATGRGVEHACSLMELMVGGVFERHETLRFAFLEAGGSWPVYWLFRLEQEIDRGVGGGAAGAKVKHRPLDYWRRQCFTNVELDEWPISCAVEYLGDENMIVTSDFPHFDAPFPHTRERFLGMKEFSDSSKLKILRGNCQRLYNL